MKSPLLSGRYAKALYEATDGKADLSAIAAKLPDAAVLAAPSIPYDKLSKVLGAESQSKEIQNLLKLLCRRKRHSLLPEIIDMYELHLEEKQGIQRATVSSAVKLEAEAIKKLESLVMNLSGAKSVKLDTNENSAMLGGFVLRIGDNLIDGSVKTRLEEFRNRF